MQINKVIIGLAVIAIFGAGIMTGGILKMLGTIDSPNTPENTYSYTLEDIYNRLNNGTAGSSSAFTEPSSGPGTGTMYDLNTIMAALPAADNGNGASDADVSIGTTFWGLRTDGTWGLQAGTAYGAYTVSGALTGTRWCDNTNGTITDLTTGLVWLQNAGWGGQYPFWVNSSDGTNAQDRAAQLRDGVGGLTDGSQEGDWRLPTRSELNDITHGTEAVSSFTPRAFSGVQSYYYWSSTTLSSNTSIAWFIYLLNGSENTSLKTSYAYVWAVRGR